MKLLMILGALIGFLTGAGFGLAGRSSGPAIFWHASAAALVSSLLMRWWGRIWMRSWKAALQARLAAQEDQHPPGKTSPALKA
jgi:hypothetical protein